MKNKIMDLLKEHVLEIEKYQITEKKLSELDKDRILKDVEEYGVTSSVRHFERLFVLQEGKIEEKQVERHKIRKKDYGKDSIPSEAGKTLSHYLTGKEQAVIITSSFYDTRPKGPHQFRKTLEVYWGSGL